jgi:hypothetical protein
VEVADLHGGGDVPSWWRRSGEQRRWQCSPIGVWTKERCEEGIESKQNPMALTGRGLGGGRGVDSGAEMAVRGVGWTGGLRGDVGEWFEALERRKMRRGKLTHGGEKY